MKNPLLSETQQHLLNMIFAALAAKGENEFIYESEWVYVLPGQSISVGGEMIHTQFPLPENYGESDVLKLAELGYFEIVSEFRDEETFCTVKIKFRKGRKWNTDFARTDGPSATKG